MTKKGNVMIRRVGLCFVSLISSFALLSTSAFAESYCLEEVKGRAAKCTKELTSEVSTGGEYLLLLVLTGVAALIALSIILPKAITFIRRFI